MQEAAAKYQAEGFSHIYVACTGTNTGGGSLGGTLTTEATLGMVHTLWDVATLQQHLKGVQRVEIAPWGHLKGM